MYGARTQEVPPAVRVSPATVPQRALVKNGSTFIALILHGARSLDTFKGQPTRKFMWGPWNGASGLLSLHNNQIPAVAPNWRFSISTNKSRLLHQKLITMQREICGENTTGGSGR